MTKTLVPIYKIGTPFQSPSWRYQALNFPEKFGLDWLFSRREVDAGHLNRLIAKDVRPASVYALPSYFRELSLTLPTHLAEVLVKTWNKHYFRNHKHKVNFNSSTTSRVPITWNMKNVALLNDDFLKRMIFHFFSDQHDRHIEAATQFFKNPNYSIQLKNINASFYAKTTDVELARTWSKPLGFIKALRLMFYDYSHWPDNRVAQLSLVKQLLANAEIDEADYHIFRRIYDLGGDSLGMRAANDYVSLSKPERAKVGHLLDVAKENNMMNIYYTISSAKDAVVFNRAAAEFSMAEAKRVENAQRGKVLELSAVRMAKEMGMDQQTTVWAEEAVLMDELREQAKRDYVPNFRSFIDIKEDDQKLIVEKNQ